METLPDFIELYRKERLQMLNTSHINNVKNRVQGDFNQGLQDYTRNFDHISKGTIQGVVLQGSVSEIVGGCRNCDAASFEL